jgi:hypothetical protein
MCVSFSSLFGVWRGNVLYGDEQKIETKHFSGDFNYYKCTSRPQVQDCMPAHVHSLRSTDRDMHTILWGIKWPEQEACSYATSNS